MGGRGSSSGKAGGGGGARNATSEKAYSKEVYNEILSKGLNSKIPGIRTKAENGTGNYSFKGATPVTYEEALKMGRTANVVTRGKIRLYLDIYLMANMFILPQKLTANKFKH